MKHLIFRRKKVVHCYTLQLVTSRQANIQSPKILLVPPKYKIIFGIFSILLQQYWTFFIALHLVIALPTLCQHKLLLLTPLLLFNIVFFRLDHGFISVLLPMQLSLIQLLRYQQLSFLYTLYLYHNSWKSDNFRKSNQEKKLRTDTKNKAKKIKRYSFTWNNSEISNIVIENSQYLKNLIITQHHTYFVFGGTNNIFADCICFSLYLIGKRKKHATNIR